MIWFDNLPYPKLFMSLARMLDYMYTITNEGKAQWESFDILNISHTTRYNLALNRLTTQPFG